MQQLFIEYKKYKLQYEVYGHGKQALFCFHGFSRTPDDFKIFEKDLGEKYTIYSFWNLLHGGSSYTGKRGYRLPVFKHQFTDIIEEFIRVNKIEKFSIMGHSLGGKFALIIVEKMPLYVNEVFLFAPDGISTNFWYRLLSNTANGRFLYKKLMNSPAALNGILNFLKDLKLMDAHVLKFLKENIETPEKRDLVYKTWTHFRKIKPNLHKIRVAIQTNRINTHVFVGKYDKIVSPKNVKNFSSKIEKYVKVHTIFSGHHLLNEKTLSYIMENKNEIFKVRRLETSNEEG